MGLKDALLGIDDIDELDFSLTSENGNDADYLASISSEINDALKGCPYKIIQLAGADLLQITINAMEANGCDPGSHFLGAFDTNGEVYQAIEGKELAFTISQQPNLQGSLPVVMATLFVTTGKKLSPPGLSNDGVYLAGPQLVNVNNLPTNSEEVCQAEGYPVCPNTLAADGSEANCMCTDRSKIKIAAVTHGVTTDSFWDTVYAAMEQARDFDVDLKVVRFEPMDNFVEIQQAMAEKIFEFCSDEGVDGILVSIPSGIVAEALKECLSLGTPVVSLNSGSSFAVDLGLQKHIGHTEFRAGKGAGQRLLKAGVQKVYCLVHEENNVALTDRCNGIKEAFEESEVAGVAYMGEFFVNPDFDKVDQYNCRRRSCCWRDRIVVRSWGNCRRIGTSALHP